MTVAELIEELQKYPSNTPVQLEDAEGYPARDIYAVRLANNLIWIPDRGSVEDISVVALG